MNELHMCVQPKRVAFAGLHVTQLPTQHPTNESLNLYKTDQIKNKD